MVIALLLFSPAHDKEPIDEAAGGSMSELAFRSADDLDPDRLRALPQQIRSVNLDKEYKLAGELFPVDNFDAMERLDRELLVNSYWHSSTLLNLKNAKRYFPMMEEILKDEGVPDDFKYVAVIESNLRNETSPAGARGLWQIMPAVGKAYGLEVTAEVDERYHLEKSTRAACRLIKSYHKRFGNWSDALGAYNMGETKFARELKEQHMGSYYEMNFGIETGRYLFRILAVKEIMENPAYFGFHVEDTEPLYQPLTDYHEVVADKTILNLGQFAKERGTTYRLLKVYNPWLIANQLTVAPGKKYEIRIPLRP